MTRFKNMVVWLVLLISTLLFLYPDFQQLRLRQVAGKTVADREGLWNEMEVYNDSLQKEGQELVDCWSYEQAPVLGEASGTETIGSIQIPAIDVELPLYAGATEKNLSRGAAVLSETSMPVGGEDTNCVIAAHRGYRGLPYFRRIDELKPGDLVEIRNSRETLVYEVERTEIILPTYLDCLEIQEGRDMVTLLSCHPYMGHSQFRYVVYCIREGTKPGNLTEETAEEVFEETLVSPAIRDSEELSKELSEAEEHMPIAVRMEASLRKVLGVLFIAVWLVLIVDNIRSYFRKGWLHEKRYKKKISR